MTYQDQRKREWQRVAGQGQSRKDSETISRERSLADTISRRSSDTEPYSPPPTAYAAHLIPIPVQVPSHLIISHIRQRGVRRLRLICFPFNTRSRMSKKRADHCRTHAGGPSSKRAQPEQGIPSCARAQRTRRANSSLSSLSRGSDASWPARRQGKAVAKYIIDKVVKSAQTSVKRF